MLAFFLVDKYITMSNLNKILSDLEKELEKIAQNGSVDAKEIASKIPLRSLTGDHINGGKIINFASAGISDQASKEQMIITDNGLEVKKFVNGFSANGVVSIDELNAEKLTAKFIQADQIIGHIEYANDHPIKFSGDDVAGKGILWAGKGHTKQFIYLSDPDRLFSSENLDLAKGKTISVNNIKLIDEKELGPTITKSNIKELGRLKGLIVDGSVSLGQYVYYDNASNRLGLGTEEPNGALSIAENGIELILGTKDSNKAYIGTYATHSIDVITDNTSRIHISAEGNIVLGNPKTTPIQVNVNGKMSIRVSNPDPEVDLHVNGSVRFSGRLQKYDRTYPTAGYYNNGDIVWNNEPKINNYVGWVCVQSGNPGLWEPFGKIGSS
jgi:hypothetical protein